MYKLLEKCKVLSLLAKDFCSSFFYLSHIGLSMCRAEFDDYQANNLKEKELKINH